MADVKQYFYTNDHIGLLLAPNGGPVDWAGAGFDTVEVFRSVSRGFQPVDANGVQHTIFPIHDRIAFGDALGNFVAMGQDMEFFYRVITEAEAIQIRDDLIAQREAQQA